MKLRYPLPNVIFHGFADDEMLEQQYLNNDVFVFPTLFEGMPTVVLEAMVHGMPIIVSNTGATIELVDAANGHLIEKNNEHQLMQAIISIVDSDEYTLQKMSVASYEKVKNNFTWEIVAQKHLSIFAQLASHHKQPSRQ
jgi:glycosyltransferase involved in cell wall biosynthesis